jgi:ergothioneine biosynthesis protein EgtB
MMSKVAPSHRPKAGDEARAATEARFQSVRGTTVSLTAALSPEDMLLQVMPDASPTRWHLAHTTWFFETFILARFDPGFTPFNEAYNYLFNSYYEAVGERWPREKRGLLSRPGLGDIIAYRHATEERVLKLLETLAGRDEEEALFLIDLGLHHEEQHQELLCTDIKAAFAISPLAPAAFPDCSPLDAEPAESKTAANERWVRFDGGIRRMGHEGDGFTFDNEGPAHDVLLQDFELHGTPVTNGQFLDFIEDGGYDTASLWLADGWAWKDREGATHPVYWRKKDGAWFEFSLHGLIPLRRDRILCHVSAYEAFAFAEWASARLPREHEMEAALKRSDPSEGQFLDPEGLLHPRLAGRDQGLGSPYGTVWDWTQSAYSAYPGYRPAKGAIGEYNGKFMSSQLVLKGGSCVTPKGHVRSSYRNFFPPDARWQFTGIRLARDV